MILNILYNKYIIIIYMSRQNIININNLICESETDKQQNIRIDKLTGEILLLKNKNTDYDLSFNSINNYIETINETMVDNNDYVMTENKRQDEYIDIFKFNYLKES